MSYTIRKIEPKDNAATAKMIRGVFEEFDAPTTGTVYSDSTTDALFEFFDNQPKSIFWVIADGHTIYGSCGIYPTLGLPNNTVELVKFYIAADARGKGYGQILLDKAIAQAQSFGYEYMYLETIKLFGKAMHMYTAKGFEFLDKPLGNTGHFACEIQMLKKL